MRHLNTLKPIDIVQPVTYFCQIYRSLIAQRYDIFPVPDKLINSMVQFSLNAKNLEQKTYLLKDLNQKYCKNWKYYHTFKYNIERMIKKNLTSNITIIKFSSNQDLEKIQEKYPPIYLEYAITLNTKAVIYQYTQNFDICLLINGNSNSRFNYYKSIQHQLIHWMQVVLNAESHMTYGIFNKFNQCINQDDINFLIDCFRSRHMYNTIQYVLNEIEFQAWCANTVENFQESKFTLQQLQSIIENRQLFKEKCNQYILDQDIVELLMFTQICYLASKNNPADDRYWYLIEAIKENGK